VEFYFGRHRAASAAAMPLSSGRSRQPPSPARRGAANSVCSLGRGPMSCDQAAAFERCEWRVPNRIDRASQAEFEPAVAAAGREETRAADAGRRLRLVQRRVRNRRPARGQVPVGGYRIAINTNVGRVGAIVIDM